MLPPSDRDLLQPSAREELGSCEDYENMVSAVQQTPGIDALEVSWEKVEGESAAFLDNLVKRYHPTCNAAASQFRSSAVTRWIDKEDLPKFPSGVVVAAQVSRPPRDLEQGPSEELGAVCAPRAPT